MRPKRVQWESLRVILNHVPPGRVIFRQDGSSVTSYQIANALSEPNLMFWVVAQIEGWPINAVADGLDSYHDATPIME